MITSSSSSSGFSSDFSDDSQKEKIKQLVAQKSEENNIAIKKKASRIVEQSAALQALQTFDRRETMRSKISVPKHQLIFEKGSCED